MLAALAKAGWSGEAAALEATCVKAQRRAHGGKGGPRTGDRSLARWRDDQDPRPHRRDRPTGGHPPHARQRQRREDRARRAGPGARPGASVDRRQGLRCRLAAAEPAGAGHQRGHPATRARTRKIRLDKQRSRDRWRIEAVFCRLKDFRRIATRDDELARNFASALALAAVVAFWCRLSLDPRIHLAVSAYRSPIFFASLFWIASSCFFSSATVFPKRSQTLQGEGSRQTSSASTLRGRKFCGWGGSSARRRHSRYKLHAVTLKHMLTA